MYYMYTKRAFCSFRNWCKFLYIFITLKHTKNDLLHYYWTNIIQVRSVAIVGMMFVMQQLMEKETSHLVLQELWKE